MAGEPVPVRIRKAVAGPNLSWKPGQIVEMTEEEAMKWADGVRAERVETTSSPPPATPERTPRPATTQPPPETTAPAPAKKARRTAPAPAKKARRTVAGGGTPGKRGR